MKFCPDAAGILREVKEELGLKGQIDDFIGSAKRWTKRIGASKVFAGQMDKVAG